MKLDRFKAPGASDDDSTCQHCGNVFKFDALDKNGLCPDCHSTVVTPDESEGYYEEVEKPADGNVENPDH